MPQPRVPAVPPYFFGDDRIRTPQQVQPLRRHLAEDAHGQARSGKRLAHHEFFVESQLPADDADLVLEQLAQRLDELHPHSLRQSSDVVMALDQRCLADDRHRLDHVGIQRPLCQEIDLTELLGLGLEHVDERRPDDLAFPLRIADALQPIEKQLRCVDEDQRQLQPFEALPDLSALVQPEDAVVDEDAREAIADGAMENQRGDGRVDAP